MYSIGSQSATQLGSNSSQVSFSYWVGAGSITNYVNKSTDSTIIGNYFSGYYYDRVLWFFQLDWSADKEQNVRIVDSTIKCSSWYGYKLGWYAYSKYSGFMDFDYNNDIFVYYCEIDQKLHGYAYTKYNWFQNFEGIGINILPANSLVNVTWTGIFVNDNTHVGLEKTYTWSDSSSDFNSLWGNVFNFDDTKESLFYIIK